MLYTPLELDREGVPDGEHLQSVKCMEIGSYWL